MNLKVELEDAESEEMASGSGEKNKIPCCSRSNIERANERVILKDAVSGDLAERVSQRFKEIYANAVQHNVSFNNKTWGEATEEGNSTIDFDPVNSELKERMEEGIQQLDDVIVETMERRKTVPPELSRQLGRLMKSKRKAIVNMQSVENNPAQSRRLPLSNQKLQQCSSKLQRTCTEFSSASKSLPSMEDKLSRLNVALRSSQSMVTSTTYQVMQEPMKEATSASLLKKRPMATPSLKKTDPSAAKRVRHSLPFNQYYLRSASKSSLG